eukprot:bmy_00991T0
MSTPSEPEMHVGHNEGQEALLHICSMSFISLGQSAERMRELHVPRDQRLLAPPLTWLHCDYHTRLQREGAGHVWSVVDIHPEYSKFPAVKSRREHGKPMIGLSTEKRYRPTCSGNVKKDARQMILPFDQLPKDARQLVWFTDGSSELKAILYGKQILSPAEDNICQKEQIATDLRSKRIVRRFDQPETLYQLLHSPNLVLAPGFDLCQLLHVVTVELNVSGPHPVIPQFLVQDVEILPAYRLHPLQLELLLHQYQIGGHPKVLDWDLSEAQKVWPYVLVTACRGGFEGPECYQALGIHTEKFTFLLMKLAENPERKSFMKTENGWKDASLCYNLGRLHGEISMEKVGLNFKTLEYKTLDYYPAYQVKSIKCVLKWPDKCEVIIHGELHFLSLSQLPSRNSSQMKNQQKEALTERHTVGWATTLSVTTSSKIVNGRNTNTKRIIENDQERDEDDVGRVRLLSRYNYHSIFNKFSQLSRLLFENTKIRLHFNLSEYLNCKENPGPTLFQGQRVEKKSKERTEGLRVETPAEESAKAGVASDQPGPLWRASGFSEQAPKETLWESNLRGCGRLLPREQA